MWIVGEDMPRETNRLPHRPAVPGDRRSARSGPGCRTWSLTSVLSVTRQTHDIPNLFISDGSQFTTGGAENPTLTIVTLAIRQADYIAQQMSAKSL